MAKGLMIGGAALAIAFATPAFAQDDVEKAPFSGFYIGGSFGYDVQPNDVGETIEFDRDGNGDFRDTVTTSTGANAFSPGFCNGRAFGPRPDAGCRNDEDDISYSGRVGFDIQRGPFVVGVIGEFGKSQIRDGVSAYSTTPAYYTMTRRVDWEGAVRGRAGYAANTTLFYGTAGVGYTKIKNRFTTSNGVNAFSASNDNERWGLNAGGGIEQKIGKNFSIGLEYMFHRYKDDDYRVRATAGTAPATNPFILPPNTGGTDFRRNFDYFRWHSLKATAAFRF